MFEAEKTLKSIMENPQKVGRRKALMFLGEEIGGRVPTPKKKTYLEERLTK